MNEKDGSKIKERVSVVGKLFIVATVLLSVFWVYIVVFLCVYDVISLLLFASLIFVMATITYYGFRQGQFMEVDMEKFMEQAETVVKDANDSNEKTKKPPEYAYIS